MQKQDTIKEAIREMKIADKLLYERTPCTKEENEKYEKIVLAGGTLPENVYPYKTSVNEYTGEFYTAYEPQYTHEEIMEYLALKTYKKVSAIKTLVTIVLILLCIPLALSILAIL